MADGQRTIKIRFDGSAAGFTRAARKVQRELDKTKSKWAAVGKGLGDLFSGQIMDAFEALPGRAKVVAVAAAATIATYMSAAIGAAMTAGILLALSGGVIAAGIKAAAKSPQVQKAWKTFADRGKKALKGFSDPFIGPVSRALDTLGDTVDKLKPDLKQIGTSMAPIIDKLAPALGKLAENAMPGIKNALEASKPLWDTLAEHLPKIGKSIEKFFDEISDGGPGAARFFDDALTWAEGFLVGLGWVIGKLGALYGWFRDLNDKTVSWFARLGKFVINVLGDVIQAAASAFGWIPGLGPKLKAAAVEFEKFRKKANAELSKIQSRTVKVNIVTRHLDDGTVHSHTDNAGGGRAGTGRLAGARAAGGPVAAGRTYLVGEHGPELFTAPTAGRITPNDQLGPDVLALTLDLGHGIQQVVEIQLRGRDRQLRRRVGAGVPA